MPGKSLAECESSERRLFLRSRPPLQRMARLHELLQAGTFPNCSRAAREMEVSSKTVQRDLDFMKYRLDLPIEYNRIEHGFYYSSPVSHFPMIQVSHGELFALLVAQKALDQYRGTAFEKPLRTAFVKLASSLREESGVSLDDLGGAVSFRPQGVSVAELDVFQTLAEAVIGCEEVEFSHAGLTRADPEIRRVRPYHLGCMANHWYLIGHDAKRNAVRTFAVSRIHEVRRTGAKFQRPADFSVSEMFEGSFSAFESGEVQEVRLRLDAFAAKLASERQWHPSQKLEPLEAGHCLLTLRVSVAPDLENWVLGWGKHAEALAPESLRERIRQITAEMAAIYR